MGMQGTTAAIRPLCAFPADAVQRTAAFCYFVDIDRDDGFWKKAPSFPNRFVIHGMAENGQKNMAFRFQKVEIAPGGAALSRGIIGEIHRIDSMFA